MKRISIRKDLLLFILISIIMSVYYLSMNPMYIFDTDDWQNVLPSRTILPEWGGWNPSKVLPENLFPLATIIAKVISPCFYGDIVTSASFVYVIICSTIIALLIVTICKVISKDSEISIIMGLFIFSALLILFDKNDSNANFVFSSLNVTCIFNYLIPNIYNMIIVLLLNYKVKDEGIFFLKGNYVKIGLLAIIIYLSVFSNLYSSIILISYTCYQIFRSAMVYIRHKKTSPCIFLWLYIIVLYLISIIFEYNGGRSAQVGNDNFLDNIILSAKNAFFVLSQINTIILMLIIITNIVAIIFGLLRINKEKKYYYHFFELIFMCFAAEIILLAYYILLDAKAGIGHINEGSTMMALYFYIIFMTAVSLSVLLEIIPSIKIVGPFLCILFISIFIKDINTVRYNNYNNLEPRIVRLIDYDMIEQLENAIALGQSETQILIPLFKSSDNWPIAIYGSQRFSRAIYLYSDINRQITVEFVPTEEKNKQYGIPIL